MSKSTSEPNSISNMRRRKSLIAKFSGSIFIKACLFIIGLGSFSEAFILVESLYLNLIGKFTNHFEYEKLTEIKVNNTKEYIESSFGSPRITKSVSDDNLKANYYIDEKYLLTVFYDDDRVAAYTVIALEDGFDPVLPWHSDVTENRLETSAFSGIADAPDQYLIENAVTNNFYIELVEFGLDGLYLNAYIGSIEYGKSPFTLELLRNLYQYEVFGRNDEEAKALTDYRSRAIPNMYGQGQLDLAVIQQGLLTAREFYNYFNIDN